MSAGTPWTRTRVVAGLLLLFVGLACAESDPGSEVEPLGAAGFLSRLTLPPGFVASIYADDLPFARVMAWSPDATLLVSQPTAGRIVELIDDDADGRAESRRSALDDLDSPHGLVFWNDWLYVAETGRVVRTRWSSPARPRATEVVVPDLPARGQHWTRSLTVDDGGHLYVAVGSSCNVCIEDDPRRAAVTRYDADGGNATAYATGLRNAVGLARHPITGAIWAADNGRDWMGDDLPPEEINVLREGADYGWPHAWGDRQSDPQFGAQAPERVAASLPPVATLPAHTAPLGLAFYTAEAFPEEFRGDLFVTLHGSWNRSTPRGFEVVRLQLEGPERSTPDGVVPFLGGMLGAEGATGRPVDVAVGPSGDLFVSDDRNGWILRIRYAPDET